MAIIAMPAGVAFTDAEWTLQTPAQVNRSGWTGARRVARLPGAAHWTVKCKPVSSVANDSLSAKWRAFFAALDGVINSFLLPVSTRPQHAGFVTAQVKAGAVSGASQFTVKGLPASTKHLVAGQFMSVLLPQGKWQMVILTSDLDANGSGEALATFRPPVRGAPAVDAAVETKFPFCEVTLVAPEVSWTEGRGRKHDFSIDAEENI